MIMMKSYLCLAGDHQPKRKMPFMRALMIAVFFILYQAGAFGQFFNTDLPSSNYVYNRDLVKNNKIKTLTIETFFSGERNAGKSIYYFDKHGLLTKEIKQDSAGVLESESYLSFNSHNDLISKIHKDYEHGRVDTIVYFKFYSGDKLVKDSSSALPISFNYEYNTKGVLLKTSISLSSVGYKTKRIILNKIDSANRIVNVTETVYENEKEGTMREISNRDVFYNQQGEIEKEIEKLNTNFYEFGNKGSVNYVYDSKGNVLQIKRPRAASYTFTYNEKGLITSEKMEMKLEEDRFMDTDTDVTIIYKYQYTFR